MDERLRSRQRDCEVTWAYTQLRLLGWEQEWLRIQQSGWDGGSAGDWTVGGRVCLGSSVRTLVLDHKPYTYRQMGPDLVNAGLLFRLYLPDAARFVGLFIKLPRSYCSDLASVLVARCGTYVTLKSIRVTTRYGVSWFKGVEG
jgi:hypothetical protein